MDNFHYQRLKKLQGAFQTASPQEKLLLLNQDPLVQETPLMQGLSPSEELLAKQLIALGESSILFSTTDLAPIRTLMTSLAEIDHFYREIGGLIGYQCEIQCRMDPSLATMEDLDPIPSQYHPPPFIDISQESPEIHSWVRAGIEALPQLAEFYPLGGAADRLHLMDEKTATELPAAKLPFAGYTLFERLIRDLQAREFLAFRLTGQEHLTPLAIMTSQEKDNHRHVLSICEEALWFGRPKELFRLFTQPLVPAVDAKGRWIVTGPATLLLKPGGHGALWKLAKDRAIFEWLRSLGRSKALIRQINNPLAGTDAGLLAFLGYGISHQMHFGFASCPRLLKAAEGVNVLIEKRHASFKELTLTNIEYCDFQKFGIEDAPLQENSPYSRYSSNTNILFADLPTLQTAIQHSPFPGLLINLKNSSYKDASGHKKESPIARLESTMQNIADVLIEQRELAANNLTEKTFVTYNHRHKTISTAKKAYLPGGVLEETPECCFFDLLKTTRELLEKECQFQLPPPRTREEFLQKGPECLFLYHPALGPLYSLIRQKLHHGSISLGSVLQLEIAELSIHQLHLQGSLYIEAEHLMGTKDAAGILHYSEQLGQCLLENVTIDNRGVDWLASKPYWKGRWHCNESVRIHLQGRSEFRASNVHLVGSHEFHVEEGTRLEVSQHHGILHLKKTPLPPGPLWNYRWDKQGNIQLQAQS